MTQKRKFGHKERRCSADEVPLVWQLLMVAFIFVADMMELHHLAPSNAIARKPTHGQRLVDGIFIGILRLLLVCFDESLLNVYCILF